MKIPKNYPKVKMITSSESINISRVLGFIQTDGNISYGFDKKDMVFRPRFVISTSEKNEKILRNLIGPFLKSHGITSTFQKRIQPSGNSVNMYIERQANVQKLMQLIENNKVGGEILLVDDKLYQYMALKNAFALNEERKSGFVLDSESILKMMIDLRISVMLRNNQKRNGFLREKDWLKIEIARKELEWKCNVVSSYGAAKLIIGLLEENVNTSCENLFSFLKNQNMNSLNAPPELKDFIFSILEGDGSFQVNFLCEGSQNENMPTKFKEFGLAMTVTDGCVQTKNHYLLEIIKFFFQGQIEVVQNESSNANRLVIKAHREMKEIMNFVKSNSFINENDAQRFTFFEFCFENYEEIHKKRDLALFLVGKLQEYGDPRYFKYSTEQRISLINEFFDSLESS